MQVKKLVLDTNVVLAEFGLSRNFGCRYLDELLEADGLAALPSVAERLRLRLQREGDFWNEEELKMHFIALLFDMVDFSETDEVKLFYERPLSAVLGGYKIQVVCDCLLAKPYGIGAPARPYFFLQEFKKQRNAGDAEGQMLASMLVAQHDNADDSPVYGSFVQGKNWTFATLHEKNYCVSRQFDASEKGDLQRIWDFLLHLKAVVLTKK